MTAQKTEENTVNLSWLEPEDDGNSSITSYVVLMNGEQIGSVSSTSSLSYSVNDLQQEVLYTFEVYAMNWAGSGLLSDPVSITLEEVDFEEEVESIYSIDDFPIS